MELFVYGTLTDPERVASVLPAFEFGDDATLHGLHRVDGRHPTLAPGGTVEGRLLRTDHVEALDSYERVDRGLYVRIEVPRADGPPVQTYVGDPERLGVDADWPAGDSLANRVRDYVADNDVVVSANGRRDDL